MLLSIDWKRALLEYERSSPYNFSVIDDAIDPAAIGTMHQEMLNSWAWRHKNWVVDHLHNNDPRGPNIDSYIDQLRSQVAIECAGLSYKGHWGLLYRANERARFHSDHADITVTLWLTPHCHNLDENSGGMLISPRKRPEQLAPEEYLNYERVAEIMSDEDVSNSIRIPYRQGRAVLFDSRNFHRTDDLAFRGRRPIRVKTHGSVLHAMLWAALAPAG